jgi:hypothetical protein
VITAAVAAEAAFVIILTGVILALFFGTGWMLVKAIALMCDLAEIAIQAWDRWKADAEEPLDWEPEYFMPTVHLSLDEAKRLLPPRQLTVRSDPGSSAGAALRRQTILREACEACEARERAAWDRADRAAKLDAVIDSLEAPRRRE